MRRLTSSKNLLFLVAAGCAGEGTWEVETWGEAYIEEEIPTDAFADGCSVTFDRFQVVFQQVALVDGDGADVGALPGGQLWDVAAAGPHPMGELTVPADHYTAVRAVIGPDASATAKNLDDPDAGAGASVVAAGTLTCPSGVVSFDWSFTTTTAYACEPEDLTIAAGGSDASQLTVHGDHLFYDGLANDDAEVRGEAIRAADADANGEVTLAELAAVDVAGLGYQVGPYADVTDLAAFVTFLTRTLGHIDGEGHCQVDL